MDSNRYFICRTCLKKKPRNGGVELSLKEDNSFILEMLSFTIPELDIFLVNDPAVCSHCVKLLKTSFEFKTECLKNEECILKYSQNNNKNINMSEICALPIAKKAGLLRTGAKSSSNNKGQSKKIRKNKIMNFDSSSLSCENCYGCTLKINDDPALHKKVCIPPFYCYHCNKSLNNLQDMRKHVLQHVKPRKCKICLKQFRDLYMLKTHLRVHTQANPYKCHLCNKTFRQYYNLKQHLDKHVGSESVTCKYCNKIFSTKYNAKIHMQNMHKVLESCDLCGERFLTKKDLVQHLHSSTNICKVKEEINDIEECHNFKAEDLIKIEPISNSDTECDINL